MSVTNKLPAGERFPALSWAAVGGGKVDLSVESGWRLFFVYRGKHCPLCKRYFKKLNEMLDAFREAGVSVLTVSADTEEKAKADVETEGWRFPVGYGLTPDEMRMLGLYITEPSSPQQTDRPFSEPGMFAINPDGRVIAIDISNVPYARPDLETLLAGLKYEQTQSFPVRGTFS
ncbi:MAG: peroxiredoxin family protein [Hyphomicrobiales bacterium]|nr:peroxiredoxin family protein [Hyphomicrobiales bacterium]